VALGAKDSLAAKGGSALAVSSDCLYVSTFLEATCFEAFGFAAKAAEVLSTDANAMAQKMGNLEKVLVFMAFQIKVLIVVEQR
jgi:hypothetical protein